MSRPVPSRRSGLLLPGGGGLALPPDDLRLPRRTFLGLLGGLGLAGVTGSGLSLLGCAEQKGRLGGGPYVLDVRPDAAVVGAITDGPRRLRLRWGPANGDLTGAVTEDQPQVAHGLEATGLLAGTTYRYVLDDGGATMGEATFTTAPARDAARVTFCALGDSGFTTTKHGGLIDDGEEAFEEVTGTDAKGHQGEVVSALVGASRPDFVLHTGDVVYMEGAADRYAEGYFQPFAPLIAGTPVYATLGNHDVKTNRGAPFLERFRPPRNGFDGEGRTYSFDWGPVHVVCLDVMSSEFGPDSPQLRWLEQDLAATDRPWRVAFFHAPPFGASRHGDSEQLQQSVVPALERGKVDLVLSGHDHVYARFFPVGHTTYVVTGGGGKSLYPVSPNERLAYAESVYHFVEVVIDGATLRLSAIDARGRPFDALTLRKA